MAEDNTKLYFHEDAFDNNKDVIPGIWIRSNRKNELKEESLPIHKYCQNFIIRSKPPLESEILRIRGLSIFLTELHGNSNIGHEMRADLFLAQILRSLSIVHKELNSELKNNYLLKSTTEISEIINFLSSNFSAISIYIYDGLDYKEPMHRQNVIKMLINDIFLHIPVLSVRDKTEYPYYNQLLKLTGKKEICFDTMIQKITTWSGDIEDAAYFRNKAHDFCQVDKNQIVDTIFVEAHHETRKWHNVSVVTNMIKQHEVSYGMRVIVEDLSTFSFCDQVRLFSRTRFALMNHGAAVAGNSLFLPTESVVIEVYSLQINEHSNKPEKYLCETPNQEFMKKMSLNYIGACIGYFHQCKGDYKPNMDKSQCEVELDIIGLRSILYILQKDFFDQKFFESKNFMI